jgi:polar amino acid transport system substrate-binding protein
MEITRILPSVAFAGALFVASGVAYAGGKLHCVSLEYPPLVFADADKRAQGIAVDVVKLALEPAGWSVEVEILPWARSLKLIQEGQRDCIFTIFKTPEREEFLDFSQHPILVQPINLYTQKASRIRFDGDLSKLKDRSFSAVFKVNYGEKFAAKKAELKVIEEYTATDSFLQLGRNRVDLVISNVYLAAYELGNGAASVAGNIVELHPPVETVTSYIAFPKNKNTQARIDFDANIDKVLKGNGGKEFKRILDKYQIPSSLRTSLVK